MIEFAVRVTAIISKAQIPACWSLILSSQELGNERPGLIFPGTVMLSCEIVAYMANFLCNHPARPEANARRRAENPEARPLSPPLSLPSQVGVRKCAL